MALDLFGSKTYAVVLQIQTLVQQLNMKVEALMSQQDDLNAVVTQINTAVQSVKDAAARLEAEIADLKAANAPVDLSGVTAAAADLDSAVAALQAVQ